MKRPRCRQPEREAAVAAPGASSAQEIACRRSLRIITRWWVPRCTEFYGEWHWSLFWRLSCKFRVYFINFIEFVNLTIVDMPLPSSHFLLYVGLHWAASHITAAGRWSGRWRRPAGLPHTLLACSVFLFCFPFGGQRSTFVCQNETCDTSFSS